VGGVVNDRQIDAALLRRFVWPRHRARLTLRGAWLACAAGHDSPVIDGVPVVLLEDVPQTIGIAQASIAAARRAAAGDAAETPYYVSTVGITQEKRRDVARPQHTRANFISSTHGLRQRDHLRFHAQNHHRAAQPGRGVEAATAEAVRRRGNLRLAPRCGFSRGFPPGFSRGFPPGVPSCVTS
jgi:hypothetical protein